MTNQIGGKPNQELEIEPESTVVTDVDPAELEEVPAIDAPIWEGITDRHSDLGRTMNRWRDLSAIAGGDRDINTYLAEVAGEDAIGGTTTTPDWNVVDEMAASVGIEMPNGGILHTSEILEHRDTDRWELDPESAEDHQKHQQ